MYIYVYIIVFIYKGDAGLARLLPGGRWADRQLLRGPNLILIVAVIVTVIVTHST